MARSPNRWLKLQQWQVRELDELRTPSRPGSTFSPVSSRTGAAAKSLHLRHSETLISEPDDLLQARHQSPCR
jgi:hypothetical protein